VLILVDSRIPGEAKEALSRHGELIDFQTEGIVYEAVSGHPDLFFCKLDRLLLAAANLPCYYQELLKKTGTQFQNGKLRIGDKYPATARYCAVVTDDFLFHRLDITDPHIINSAVEKEKIFVAQGYTRCSLLPLNNRYFISSDKGICRTLDGMGLNVLYVENKQILLPGYANGFFGGACGVDNGRVFILGRLRYHPDGDRVRDFLEESGHEIVELADGPLFDGGGILFL
jgi:hypothetical protein